MPHSTSTDRRVLPGRRVFFGRGVLFGVKVRRYYHASRRSSEIDRKKQRYLFFFSERSRSRPIPYDLEHRFRILRAIVVNLFSERRDAITMSGASSPRSISASPSAPSLTMRRVTQRRSLHWSVPALHSLPRNILWPVFHPPIWPSPPPARMSCSPARPIIVG